MSDGSGEVETPLSVLYARRLAAAGYPLDEWGEDAGSIWTAWKAMEENPGLGLIVGGKFGRGKTTLIHAMINWPRCDGYKAVHTSSRAEMALLDGDECPKEHLFIDDILADNARVEFGTARDSVAEYLRWWMDKKSWHGWKKRLFLTTNGTLDDLNDRYGVRLASRIMECCEPLTLRGGNRRAITGGKEAWKRFGT